MHSLEMMGSTVGLGGGPNLGMVSTQGMRSTIALGFTMYVQ